MMGVGGLELLLFLLISAGDPSPDAVTLVPPRAYFEARGIDLSLDTMFELATREPRNPKAQIQQLLALRHLEQEAGKITEAAKSSEYRKQLAGIAAGSIAADPLGFSREYAQRVLARIDRKSLVQRPQAAVADGTRWFPTDCNGVFGVSLERPAGPGFLKTLGESIANDAPAGSGNQVYELLEVVGNFRIERVTLGARVGDSSDLKENDDQFFLRVSGKASVEWIIAGLQPLGVEIERADGAKGEKLVYVDEGKPVPGRVTDWPGVLFIDNGDLVIAGYPVSRKGGGRKALERLLAVRSGKEPDVWKGWLGKRLKQIPLDASGLAVWNPTKASSGTILSGLSALDGFSQRTADGLDVKGSATMISPEKAAIATDKLSKDRKEAIAMLRKLQMDPPAPGLPIDHAIEGIKNIQARQEQSEVRVRLMIANSTLQALPLFYRLVRSPDPVPPPPPARPPQKK